jgi:hypothetical protein
MAEQIERCRVVVVKDKPSALRPYQWAAERPYGSEWRLEASGRAFSLSGAIAKGVKRGLIFTGRLERLELEVYEKATPQPPERRDPTPLPPEILDSPSIGEAGR